MRILVILLTIAALPPLDRQISYVGAAIGGDSPLPTFDKGYLLFLGHPCEIAVYNPDGNPVFSRRLSAPGSRPCSPLSAAVDSDGAVAVSISYSGPAGYAAGILLLGSDGNGTSFVDTNRYLPSHICFDRRHALWSIGWQRDEIRTESADGNEHFIVRKFSRDGRQAGAFLPRSLWGRKGEPGASGLGYWHIAAADDRIGALVYENHADNSAEWIEWNLDGKLLSRTPVQSFIEGGRAYTSDGRLFGKIWDKTARSYRLVLLDRTSGAWKPVSDPCAGCGLLMGADGEDLVYRARGDGVVQLLWLRPPAI